MKHTYFKLFLLTFCCIIAAKIEAQELVRQFTTQQVNNRLRREHPELRESYRDTERFIGQYRQIGDPPTQTIPIVFHVLYHTPEEEFSVEQLHSQYRVLGQHFNHENITATHPADSLEGFRELRPDSTGIRFCLAKDTTGPVPIYGLNYVYTDTTVWTDNDAMKSSATGGADPWNTEQYLNIWVVHLADSISGYAQMPGGPAETDGIVIDYRFFGTEGTAQAPYNEGKTLTHLIGSYLGLYELWGWGNCIDDYVFDTPIHNAPNYGCPGYKHVSVCSHSPVEMTMNFMDNTDDACMYMFTYGQWVRMLAVLAPRGPRQQLTTGENTCTTENETWNLVDSRSEENSNASQVTVSPVFSVRLHPNPTSGKTTILIEGITAFNATVTVYDLTGKRVYEGKYDSTQAIQLDGSNWHSGLYLVQVKTDTDTQTTSLVISN